MANLDSKFCMFVFGVVVCCHIVIVVVTADIVNIRLHGHADDGMIYKGKVEVRVKYCSVWGCSTDWYAVCHNGSADSNHKPWDRTSAIVACRQLGYDGGWDGASQDITTEYSVEGFTCSADDTTMNMCRFDDDEYCGCSSISYRLFNNDKKCNDHYMKDQAAVECYATADTDIRLSNPHNNRKSQGELEVRYRDKWYNVCYNGNDAIDDEPWSLKDADVACRQLGFPHAASTHSVNSIRNQSFDGSFDDFRCYGDEIYLFDCLPDSPSNNFECGMNNYVFINCNTTGFETSMTTSKHHDINLGGLETSMVTSRTQDVITEEAFTNDHYTNGKSAGMTAGIVIGIALFIVLITALVIFVKFRNRRVKNQPEPPTTASTTVHSNETFQNATNDYDEIQNGRPTDTADYTYAYADVTRRNPERIQSDISTEHHTDGTNSVEGWADNIAYVSYGDDGVSDHGDTGVQEGWMENEIYGDD